MLVISALTPLLQYFDAFHLRGFARKTNDCPLSFFFFFLMTRPPPNPPLFPTPPLSRPGFPSQTPPKAVLRGGSAFFSLPRILQGTGAGGVDPSPPPPMLPSIDGLTATNKLNN